MTRAALRAAAAYALLVLSVSAPFTLASGMPHETTFAQRSESGTGGFLWPDPMRPYMTVFFHLAYLLGEWAGIGGSFLPYQLLYALLWWARGMLVFWLAQRLLPGRTPFAFALGALSLLASPDYATNWSAAMNQAGMIVWTLAAFCALVLALEARRAPALVAAALAAGGFAHLSVWSYESQVPLMLALPALLVLALRSPPQRALAALAPYGLVLLAYLLASANYYLVQDVSAYQSSSLRSDWSPLALADDLGFNVIAALAFWRWDLWAAPLPTDAWLDALATVSAACFALTLGRELWQTREASAGLPDCALARRLLLLGVALLLLGLPAYVMLAAARTLYRTQLLSPFGTALVFVSGAAWLAARIDAGWGRRVAFLLVCATIAWFGAHSALKMGGVQRHTWERQRVLMAELLRVAPDLAAPAWIELGGVSRHDDPFFGENLWFVTALKLAYPGREVSGRYARDDGTLAPSAVQAGLEASDPARLLRVDWREGELRLLSAAPGVIRPGPPSPRALRRYGVAETP